MQQIPLSGEAAPEVLAELELLTKADEAYTEGLFAEIRIDHEMRRAVVRSQADINAEQLDLLPPDDPRVAELRRELRAIRSMAEDTDDDREA